MNSGPWKEFQHQIYCEADSLFKTIWVDYSQNSTCFLQHMMETLVLHTDLYPADNNTRNELYKLNYHFLVSGRCCHMLLLNLYSMSYSNEIFYHTKILEKLQTRSLNERKKEQLSISRQYRSHKTSTRQWNIWLQKYWKPLNICY